MHGFRAIADLVAAGLSSMAQVVNQRVLGRVVIQIALDIEPVIEPF